MNPSPFDFRTFAATLFALWAFPAFGQQSHPAEVSPSTDDAATADEIVFLDPFVVSAAEDRDTYEATATTAATRIRTELKDVGSAISVVTTQFLKDTNSHHSQDLLVYTTNTEVGGLGGNFAGLGGGAELSDQMARLAPQTNTRIRGLTAADNTRDFFLTDVAWDAFNTGRIDIQRGPNAILFGLGSPAGIINASTNGAAFTNEGSLNLSFARFGSHRTTLDFNQVLRRDELAVRFAALDDRTNYQQEPAFNRDRRWFGALRWDPKFLRRDSAHTSLRLNFEHGKIDANRPHILPPTDRITPWFTSLNRIGIDPATWQNDPNVNQLVAALDGPILAIFADPASGAGTLSGVRAPGVNNAPGPALAVLKKPSDYIAKSFSPAEQFKVYRSSVLQDPSVFDYVHRLIEGPNKREWSDHDIANITLAQTFLHDRIGVEAAYNHEESTRGATSASADSTLTVDINRTQPDGRTNPNFGRPYVTGRPFGNGVIESTRVGWRLTGYGELRFADFMQQSPLTRLLGRHVFTGFSSREQADLENYDWISPVAAASLAPHTGGISIYNRLIGTSNYLGPSLSGRTSAAGANLPGVRAVQRATSGTMRYYDVGAATPGWADLPLTVVNNFDGARINGNHAQLTRDDVTSSGVIWQGFLFDGLVVPMVGLRHDRDRSYAMIRAPQNPDDTLDFADAGYALPSTATNVVAGNSTSWSVVAHAPPFIREKLPGHAGLSLFYNRSENFQPKAGRIDVFGHPLPPPSGQTNDYGIRLSLLDDRVTLKVNWYQTAVTNDELPKFGGLSALPNAEAWGYMFARRTLANDGNNYDGYAGGYAPLNGQTAAQARADGIAISTAFLAAANQPPDSFFALYGIDRSAWQSFMVGGPPPGLTITGDTKSQGTEFEITAQPVAGWNISFNASKTDAQSHNLARSLAGWIEQRWAVFNTPVAGTGPNPFTGQPTVIGDLRLWGPASTFTVRDFYREFWVPYLVYKLKDGADVNELRPWRFNFVTDYTFTQGRLAGLKLGGAYRWQDKVVLGYPVFDNANESSSAAYDLANPYMGPAESNIDLWIGYERTLTEKYTWRIQLNVNNAFANDQLIPITVQPDFNGTMAAGRIPEATIWTVTNSISF